jgi:hypothetical protein
MREIETESDEGRAGQQLGFLVFYLLLLTSSFTNQAFYFFFFFKVTVS